MCCVVSVKGLDLPPEGGQVLWAVAFPICTRANEHAAMRAISPRLATRLRSRGSRKRRWRGALFRPWGNRGEGEGRQSIILSVLVSVGGANRFGLRGGGRIGEHPSDWNKRDISGSVSNLDGIRRAGAGKDGGVDDCVGCLSGGARRKCRLGARYLGGGATAVGVHLSRVDGTGIVGHVSMIMVVRRGELDRVDDFVCFFPWGSYTPLRWALFSILSLVYLHKFIGRDVGLVNPLIVSR